MASKTVEIMNMGEYALIPHWNSEDTEYWAEAKEIMKTKVLEYISLKATLCSLT